MKNKPKMVNMTGRIYNKPILTGDVAFELVCERFVDFSPRVRVLFYFFA